RSLLDGACQRREQRLIKRRLTLLQSSDPARAQAQAPGPAAVRESADSAPAQAVPERRFTRRPGEVAVTYDNSSTDGVGSQLQRIYGLYALSRALHVKYVHTPLGRVGYQGLMPLLTGHLDPDFAVRYNAFFSLPSDDFDL